MRHKNAIKATILDRVLDRDKGGWSLIISGKETIAMESQTPLNPLFFCGLPCFETYLWLPQTLQEGYNLILFTVFGAIGRLPVGLPDLTFPVQ